MTFRRWAELAALILQVAMKVVTWIEHNKIRTEAERAVIERAKVDANVQITAALRARFDARARFERAPDELRKPDEFTRAH